MFSQCHRKCAERPHSVSERAKQSMDGFVTRSVTISSRGIKKWRNFSLKIIFFTGMKLETNTHLKQIGNVTD
jgi:hypothetical protein